MKKKNIMKYFQKLNLKKKYNIKTTVENNPFIRENLLFISALFILLFILIFSISCFYMVILKEEKTVDSIDITGFSLQIEPDSFLRIQYNQGNDDKILFNLKLKNTGEEQPAEIVISCGEKIQKKEKFHNPGVKEVYPEKNRSSTKYHYEVDFQDSESLSFIQSFSCNLFEDKLGDINFRLRLNSSSKIFNEMSLSLVGLDFNLTSVFPPPEKEFSRGMRYTYKLGDEKFLYGITLRGYNPAIEKRFRVNYFLFGVIVAILTSSLATLLIEVVKSAEKKNRRKKL